MADLTPAAYQAKWTQRFRDNDQFEIDEADFRENVADQLRTFVARAELLGKVPAELLLPQQVIGGQWYWWTTGVFEARSTFQASAAPFAGPNWRLVVPFSTYTDTQVVQAVRASQEFLLRAGQRCLLVKADGLRTAFISFVDAAAQMTTGDRLEVHGFHDYSALNFIAAGIGTLYLAAGAVLKAARLYAPNSSAYDSRLKICGPGTLNIPLVSVGSACAYFELTQVTLIGQIDIYAFSETVAFTRQVTVHGISQDSGAAVPVNVIYAHGGFYHSYVSVALYNNRLTTTAAAVVRFIDGLGGNSANPEAEAANRLRLVGNTITAPATSKVVDDTQGVFAFEQGINYYVGCAVPTKAAANTLVISPAVGGSTTPAKPDAPTFVAIDDESNEAIFQKDPDVAASGYLYTTDSGTTFQSASALPLVASQFRIPSGAGDIPSGTIGMRVAAAGATPASNISYADKQFTVDGLFRNDSFNKPATGDLNTGWLVAGCTISGGKLHFTASGQVLRQVHKAPVGGIAYRITAKGTIITPGDVQILTGSGAIPNGQNLTINDSNGIVFNPGAGTEFYFISRNGLTADIDEIRLVPA